MALGMPIAFALIVCAVAMMYQLNMMDAQIIAQNLISGADSFPLMAAPFFMLAGEIMNKGGLAKRIVNVALVAVGHFRGGLGYVTILAACILSSLSGSAAADAQGPPVQEKSKKGVGSRKGRKPPAEIPAPARAAGITLSMKSVTLEAV